jgi:hypothetical protein
VGCKLPRGQLSSVIRAPFADVARLGAQRRRPGRDVRRLSTGADARRCGAVVAGDERAVEPDDDVEDQVAERDQAHA